MVDQTVIERPDYVQRAIASAMRFGAQMGEALRANALLVGLSLLFYAVSVPLNLHFGRPVSVSFGPYFSLIFGMVMPVAALAIVFGQLIYMTIVERPESPIASLKRFYKSLLLDTRRWAKAIPTILLMLLAFDAFVNLKDLIPLINPFSWDVAFMKLDRALHFGQDPWRLLQPIFGGALVTQIISVLYIFWFIFLFSFWLGAATTAKDKGWERQFLSSLLLAWVIGGIALAALFSSMGPAFYDLIDPVNNPYADQMAGLYALHETRDVWALGAQELLRDAYLDPDPSKLSGISAMPSMHNATSTLFMLAAFRIDKKLGWVMAAFLGVIVIGSVHLAWHYAVDAYAGIALALVLWWAAGKLVAAQDRWLGVTPT